MRNWVMSVARGFVRNLRENICQVVQNICCGRYLAHTRRASSLLTPLNTATYSVAGSRSENTKTLGVGDIIDISR